MRSPLGVIATLTVAVLSMPAVATAHEGISTSEPPSGAQLDEPISEVTIDFGEPISPDLEMALLYDLGNSEVELVPSTSAKIDETVGQIQFDELSREGRYFVRYIATVPLDGHVLAGAVTFDYGDTPGGGTNWYVWLVFGIGAMALLSVTAWFSLRSRPDEASDEPAPEPVAD